jgi:hypothetical protein
VQDVSISEFGGLYEYEKVRLHRYICLWGASEWKLGKSLKPNQKISEQIKGKGLGTQPQKRLHHKYLVGSKKSSDELGYPHTEVGRPAGGAVCEC